MNLTIKNSSISTRLFVGFSIILLVVITTIIVSNINSNTIINSENLIVQTHEVLTELRDVEARLIDLETGQRGYIITGKLIYLEPYQNSMMVIDNKIDYLNSLISDNTSQTKRIDVLKEMIDNKLSELLNTIELREKLGFEAASGPNAAYAWSGIINEPINRLIKAASAWGCCANLTVNLLFMLGLIPQSNRFQISLFLSIRDRVSNKLSAIP